MNNDSPGLMLSEYITWEEGFDARTQSERSGEPAVNPYSGRQAALWQQGYAASQRVAEIGKEGV